MSTKQLSERQPQTRSIFQRGRLDEQFQIGADLSCRPLYPNEDDVADWCAFGGNGRPLSPPSGRSRHQVVVTGPPHCPDVGEQEGSRSRGPAASNCGGYARMTRRGAAVRGQVMARKWRNMQWLMVSHWPYFQSSNVATRR